MILISLKDSYLGSDARIAREPDFVMRFGVWHLGYRILDIEGTVSYMTPELALYVGSDPDF